MRVCKCFCTSAFFLPVEVKIRKAKPRVCFAAYHEKWKHFQSNRVTGRSEEQECSLLQMIVHTSLKSSLCLVHRNSVQKMRRLSQCMQHLFFVWLTLCSGWLWREGRRVRQKEQADITTTRIRPCINRFT